METIRNATFVFDHEGELDLIENELTGGAYRVAVGRFESPISSKSGNFTV